MASLHYAARYRCDFCGKIADTQAPDNHLSNTPAPAGWMVGYQPRTLDGIRFWAETMDGSRFGDICDECQQLPLTTLLATLRRKLGELVQP
jgi:hypothetical protein